MFEMTAIQERIHERKAGAASDAVLLDLVHLYGERMGDVRRADACWWERGHDIFNAERKRRGLRLTP